MSIGRDPLFTTYVRSLGFTIAKVELGVWRAYLDSSTMTAAERARAYREFETEFNLAAEFARSMLGTKDVLGSRPWLRESIVLRAPMIHPLNLLQVHALRLKDFELLRLTVTGIASGMMTTG
jgi:phosphoenolpyruvate carboxylase